MARQPRNNGKEESVLSILATMLPSLVVPSLFATSVDNHLIAQFAQFTKKIQVALYLIWFATFSIFVTLDAVFTWLRRKGIDIPPHVFFVGTYRARSIERGTRMIYWGILSLNLISYTVFDIFSVLNKGSVSVSFYNIFLWVIWNLHAIATYLKLAREVVPQIP